MSLRGSDITAPHGFVRTLNAKSDREMHLSELVRALPDVDDFRFAVGQGEAERWVLAERLAWDSEFFGYGVARLNDLIAPSRTLDLRTDNQPDVIALRAVLAELRKRGVRYLIATVPAERLVWIRTLAACGFMLIETRCSYHMSLHRTASMDRFATRLAVVEDIPSLAAAARSTINPFDRFHADPFIAPVEADRLMERWVSASIAEGFADATIVPDVDAPEAFCTIRYHMRRWDAWGLKLAQPVLSVVAPRHKGWYFKILSEVHEHLREIGAEHSYLITQFTNNAVIRSWEKLGYQFGRGEHVFRILL